MSATTQSIASPPLMVHQPLTMASNGLSPAPRPHRRSSSVQHRAQASHSDPSEPPLPVPSYWQEAGMHVHLETASPLSALSSKVPVASRGGRLSSSPPEAPPISPSAKAKRPSRPPPPAPSTVVLTPSDRSSSLRPSESASRVDDGATEMTFSSITPSQSASQVEYRMARKESKAGKRDKKGKGAEVAGETSGERRAKRLQKVGAAMQASGGHHHHHHAQQFSLGEPQRLSYRNLELAWLSTPELHLSSDPMLDTQEPIYEQRDDGTLVVVSGAGVSVPGPPSRSRTTVAEPQDSIEMLMGAGPPSPTTRHVKQERVSKRERKRSNATVRPGSVSPAPTLTPLPSLASGSSGTSPFTAVTTTSDSRNARPSSVIGAAAGREGGQPERRPPNAFSPGTWFRRNRRWSATAATTPASTVSQATTGLTTTSSATAGTGTTAFTTTATAATHSGRSMAGRTDTTLGIDGMSASAAESEEATKRLRAARAFLLMQVADAGAQTNEDDERLWRLAWFAREKEAEALGEFLDPAREVPDFWESIRDGVLLCLLVNKLRLGAIEKIDRRDVDFVRADNISRFLRAARDHLKLRSKDLFQTLDLTDGTADGLQRVVHTILAIKRVALDGRTGQSALGILSPSAIRPPSHNCRSSSPSTSLSTPLTPPPSVEPPDRPPSSSDVPFPSSVGSRPSPGASPNRPEKSPRRSNVASRQAEAEIERPSSPPSAWNAEQAVAVKARRRRTYDGASTVASSSGTVKPPSITFAEQKPPSETGESSTTAGRISSMPYRDRKLSESAQSLSGVAEEIEELSLQTTPRRPLSPMLSSSPSKDDAADGPASLMLHGGEPSLLQETPTKRRSSTRRSSGEYGHPRNSAGPSLDEYAFPSPAGSPSPLAIGRSPARRPSYRSQPGPGLASLSTSPNRVSPLSNLSQSPPRVPFPRSPSTPSSPNALEFPALRAGRVQRQLSLSTASLAQPSSVSPTSSSVSAAPPPLHGAAAGPRSAYRHMRYSSDLHLSAARRSFGMTGFGGYRSETSGDERSALGFRSRYDTEIGSIYTNTLGSTTHDEGASAVGSRLSRSPISKHKLVVTEEGKPSTTFQLGNCIGRGQFGSVYRALNLQSGQMVAVKRIKLEGKSEEEVTQLMNEVDLLKSLAHPSVVKYEGLVRGPDVVSIILEYVENGSLLHTLKAFGHFPEKLVSSYVVKILEGLHYLHSQKVVHCDLKAANILTTKNGNVKLSDFGVSLNLKAMEKIKNDAVGTPNWMAPEVIELKGASTAADIWSLACTIIELMTGKPPYGDIQAMSAMYRIVEDDCPPIPDKCSPELVDFLKQCFNKDPAYRPSAEMLFEHHWLCTVWGGHKELRAQDSVPFLRRISADFNRKLDPKVFADPGPSESKHKMERSSSSPAATIALRNGAAHTTRDSVSSPNSPSSAQPSPMLLPASASDSRPSNVLPRVSFSLDRQAAADTNAGYEGVSAGQLPSPLSAEGDLSSSGEERMTHAFVKSTFSKAVECKLCRQPVKRHAVLCEECGLICHARCAPYAPVPCNLRAQLLMFPPHRVSGEMSRVPASPKLPRASPKSQSSSLPILQTPLMSPSTFSFHPKFGFSKNKKDKLKASPAPPLASSVPLSVTDMRGASEDKDSLAFPLSTGTEEEVMAPSPSSPTQSDAPPLTPVRPSRKSLTPLDRLRSRSPDRGQSCSPPSIAAISSPNGAGRAPSTVSLSTASQSGSVSSTSNRAAAKGKNLASSAPQLSQFESTPKKKGEGNGKGFPRTASGNASIGDHPSPSSTPKAAGAGKRGMSFDWGSNGNRPRISSSSVAAQAVSVSAPNTVSKRKDRRFSFGNKEKDCVIM